MDLLSDRLKFSFSTIDNFDEHIRSSVPGYQFLFDSSLLISEFFIREHTKVIDIGCSTGLFLKSLSDKYIDGILDGVSFVGIEKEKNLSCDFKDYIDKNNSLEFVIGNITHDYLLSKYFSNISFCTSLFTLQFLSASEKNKVIQVVYDGLNKGGGFIVSEKVFLVFQI